MVEKPIQQNLEFTEVVQAVPTSAPDNDVEMVESVAPSNAVVVSNSNENGAKTETTHAPALETELHQNDVSITLMIKRMLSFIHTLIAIVCRTKGSGTPDCQSFRPFRHNI